jgi:hypothetical protein
MRDARHPVWILVRLVALFGFLYLFCWLNASEFDATEVKTILEVLLADSFTEGAIWRGTRKKNGAERQDD